MSQNIHTLLALPAPGTKKQLSIFSLIIRKKPCINYEEKRTRGAIKKMLDRVEENYKEEVNTLKSLSPDSSYIEDQAEVIKKYNLVDVRLSGRLKNDRIVPDQAIAYLNSLYMQIAIPPGAYVDERPFLRKKLADIQEIFMTTEEEIARLQPKPEVKDIPSTGMPNIQVPADLLFQVYYSLFPAERMMVISGRRSGDTVELGAAFDVTGVANGGYVSADPVLLARALISMDLSNTYLAAWIHSHPGHGVQSTFPSTIDLHQHAEWIRNYSPQLLSAIFVQDRYIRFWGTALEAKEIYLSLQFPGLTQEDANEHVYRLTS